jgi:hypothetical protein
MKDYFEIVNMNLQIEKLIGLALADGQITENSEQ